MTARYSRRHYEDTAAIMRANEPPRPDERHDAMIGAFVTLYGDDNPRFNAARFLVACGRG